MAPATLNDAIEKVHDTAANVAAALRAARQLDQGVVVTILCDGAAKYLSDRFWDEEGT